METPEFKTGQEVWYKGPENRPECLCVVTGIKGYLYELSYNGRPFGVTIAEYLRPVAPAEKPDLDLLRRQVTALEGSVMKWERVVQDGTGGRSAADCPCCQEFRKQRDSITDFCSGCPIREKTGKDGCLGTPFKDYCNAKQAGLDSAAFYAVRELRFLISLEDEYRKKLLDGIYAKAEKERERPPKDWFWVKLPLDVTLEALKKTKGR